MRNLSFASFLALLTACSVPTVDFAGTGDGGIDAPTDVALVVSADTAMVGEGGMATFTVQLSAPPSSSIPVTIDSGDDNRLGVTPSSVSFDSSNWNQPRTVTLAGREDTDTEAETVTVTLSSSVGDDSVQVTVLDNDDLGLVLAPTGTLEVGEGETAQLTVRLNAQPSGPISVAVATTSNLVATASPTVLNFGVGNWDLPATVVITGVHDADTVPSTTTLTFTPDGGLDPELVTVNVADDDVLGIQPSVANLGTLDEGDTATFTVRLNQQPTGPITVNVMPSDPTLITAMPATIAFTTADWDQPRTVNVDLPQDVDVADESASITLSAAGIMGTRTIPVSIDDDDTQVITATPNPLALDEGMTRNLDVRLAFQPSADVTLMVTSLNTNVATVGSNTLTFTAANYATPQQVMVTATQDMDAMPGMTAVRIESVADNLTRDVTIAVTDEDQLLIQTSSPTVTVTEGAMTTFMVRLTAMPAADVVVNISSGDTTAATVSPAQLTFSTSSWNTFVPVTVTGVQDLDLAIENLVLTLNAAGVPAETVDATVNDDDMQRVVVSTTTTTVLETNTVTVGVSLAFQPAGNVAVTVMSSDATGASVTPTMLTFMPGTYATPQNITITGVNDPDNVDDSVTINLTAPGATPAAVAVTVADDDILGIEPSVTTTLVGEAGTAMIGVKLTAQPPGPVTVMVMSSDTTAATVSPAMLSFTTADWDTFKNVTLTGIDDADAVNDMLSISLSAATMTTRTVTVTVQENDTQDILLSTATITLGEAGSTTFGVRLAAQPTSDVIVNVASAGGTHATASPSSLTFTSSDYTNNKTVTVTGVQDVDLASDNVAINLTSAGLMTRTVTATVNDDDLQEVIASSAGPFTINEGTTATVGFSLRFQPSGSVNVTVSSGSSGVSLDRTTLTFNAGNYSSAQNVIMTAVQDANAADITTTITATSPGAAQASVAVVVDDDEVLGIELSTTTLTVTEQATNSFGVRLTAQPTSDTVVMISSGDTGTATIAPAMYTFTSTDYNTFKNVIVTGVDDADLADEAATITLASAGLMSRTVNVTIDDNDILTIVPNFNVLTVNEGSNSGTTLTFRLSHLPAASVTVSVTSGDVTAVTVPAAPANSLTFTTVNWATPQSMTITALQDSDYSDESVTLTASSSSTPNATVTVNVPDDEIILDGLSIQMMPATGTFFDFLGNGFTIAVNATLAGTAITPLNVISPTTMQGSAPNWTAPQARFQDARVVKGANQYTIARAMYRGQWAKAITNMGGGEIFALASSGASTVYAGTENGVYRSNDNGATWFPINTGMNFAINSIAADPTNANRVYAACILGVYVTTNGGASWTRTGMNASASVVAMSAASPQTLYAAYGSAVYKTTDGGANWSSNLDMSPSPVKNIVFGTTAQITWVASTTNVARTTDGGIGWASGGSGLPTNISWIASHPTDNTTAYISANNQLYRSTNGATTWTAIGSATGATTLTQVVATGSNSVFASTTNGVWRYDGTNFSNMSTGIPSYATTMNAITAIGSSEIYAGNNYWGVYRSSNGGTSWNASSAGLDAYTVGALVTHPTALGTLFAAPGEMGIWKSTDRGATWAQSNGGFTGSGWMINDIAFSPGAPNTMWAAVRNGGVRRSTDGGVTWNTTGLTINVDSVTPESATVAYASAFGGVRKTTDSGATWTLLSSGLPANANIRHVMISDDGSIYAAESDLIYKSTNGGASWTATPSSAAINPYRLHLEPVTGTIYVQSNSGVYKTTDDGINWTQVLGGNGFAFDPMRVATLYVGASGATRRSLNNGVTFVDFTTGLPNPCHRIVVDLDGQGVYCGIGRNGLWRLAP